MSSSRQQQPLPKRLKLHLEKEVKVKYAAQMTSQLVSVMQRISAKRVSARSLMKDTGDDDTLGLATSVVNSRSYRALENQYKEDAGLLAEVMGRAHTEVYMPLVIMLREAREDPQLKKEPWVAMVERIAEALFTDITLRESVIADIGPTLEDALGVSKETLRAYMSAVSIPHQVIDAEGSNLMLRTIELVNLSC